mmetsp:Transcript_111739/g.339739  ORF Transcript_111739/g.339739 Transcript_111739/m.339739 type:complete len:576 (+) Transcript_111739:94-1821(+)
MGLKLAKLTPKSSRRISGKGLLPDDGEEEPAAGAKAELPAGPREFLLPEFAEDSVAVLTWNVSAVNNNPFEYWLSYDDPQYLDLMMGVESFLDDPGEDDVEVGSIFTEAMFQELRTLMENELLEGLDEVEQMWQGGEMRLRDRRIVSEFIKDASLGAKRLISMPDRVTNTINVVTRKESNYQPPPACRPSVMNNFEGDLSTANVWWEQWKKFMFVDPLTIRSKGGIAILRPVEMLERIARSKYPAVSEQEERLSIPLQVLCQAVFDAIIVHLMNELSPANEWQVVKSTICDKLFRGKQCRTVQILAERYGRVDVMCLQEVAAVFTDHFRASPLAASHSFVAPQRMDGKRDQNSVLLVSKAAFPEESFRDVTAEVAAFLPEGKHLSDGDVVIIEARAAKDDRPWLLASFHGDTNGMLTIPVLDALDRAMKERFPDHMFLFGLDANIYEQQKEGVQDFAGCVQRIAELGLTSCWGEEPDVRKCRTTCSARTSLQPQLNKAVRFADRVRKGGMHPKDLILFRQGQLALVAQADMGSGRQANPSKDNTGELVYNEEMVFPTLDFPSDHGVVAAVLQPAA